jgi:hypothetical protein
VLYSFAGERKLRSESWGARAGNEESKSLSERELESESWRARARAGERERELESEIWRARARARAGERGERKLESESLGCESWGERAGERELGSESLRPQTGVGSERE